MFRMRTLVLVPGLLGLAYAVVLFMMFVQQPIAFAPVLLSSGVLVLCAFVKFVTRRKLFASTLLLGQSGSVLMTMGLLYMVRADRVAIALGSLLILVTSAATLRAFYSATRKRRSGLQSYYDC